MKIIQGDFFDIAAEEYFDALVCTTNMQVKDNGDLVMGKGIAKAFAERFPKLPSRFGKRLKEGRHLNGVMAEFNSQYLKMCEPFYTERYLISLPTKIHWKHPSDIALVKRSVKILRGMVDIMNWSKILVPPPGCGNGGLGWPDVRETIEPLLDDRFHIVLRDKNEQGK